LSTDASQGDIAAKPRSFADAAALLPPVVPSPSVNPPSGPPSPLDEPANGLPPPTPAVTPAEAEAPAPAPHSSVGPVPPIAEPALEPLNPPVMSPVQPVPRGVAQPVRRKAWAAALALAVVVGVFAAWRADIGGSPSTQAPAPPAATPSEPPAVSGASSEPGRGPASSSVEAESKTSLTPQQLPASGAGSAPPEPSPALPLPADQAVVEPSPAAPSANGPAAAPAPSVLPETATPETATPDTATAEALPPAAAGPATYALIVLHPRPTSAAVDAATARAVALLQPLTRRVDVRRGDRTHGRLTVHYFHADDADAARTLADTLRAPGPKASVRGPDHTHKAWPPRSFEVWLPRP